LHVGLCLSLNDSLSLLGAIAQFEKAALVARMKAARDRKVAQGIKCGGRPGHLELRPDVVALAKALRRKTKAGKRSLRQISAELGARGHLNRDGRPFSAASMMKMLAVPAGALAKQNAEAGGTNGPVLALTL
jgi:DNA invertase Pin-like site-specific DNA recombinase